MSDTDIAPPVVERLTDNAALVMGLLLVFDSLHYVFARTLLDYLSPMVSGFYMLGIATLVTFLYLWRRGQLRLDVLRKHLLFFLVVGLMVSGATVLSFNSVRYVDAGTASLLGRSATIFSVALGLLWLRDRLSAGEWAGAAIALVGVIVISFQPGDFLRLGSLFVLASSFLYALHTAVVKRYGEDMDFSSFFLGRIGATTFFLFFFAVSSPDLVWPTWEAWLVLALAGLIGIVISRALYYLALRKLQLSNHALILTLSPVVAIIWSILFFDEAPTLQSYQGGALVIVGVMVLAWYQRQRRLQRAL